MVKQTVYNRIQAAEQIGKSRYFLIAKEKMYPIFKPVTTVVMTAGFYTEKHIELIQDVLCGILSPEEAYQKLIEFKKTKRTEWGLDSMSTFKPVKRRKTA